MVKSFVLLLSVLLSCYSAALVSAQNNEFIGKSCSGATAAVAAVISISDYAFQKSRPLSAKIIQWELRSARANRFLVMYSSKICTVISHAEMITSGSGKLAGLSLAVISHRAACDDSIRYMTNLLLTYLYEYIFI